ncbi:MAG: FecR family protein [Elusimicrobiales bacterium]
MKNLLIAVLFTLAALPAAAGQMACIYDLEGEVSVQRPGGAAEKGRKGLALNEGDSLRTGGKAWCELLFKDGSYVKLDADSEVSIEKLLAGKEERALSFSFLRGKALWMAAKLKKIISSKFSIRTPNAVCAVRGTDFTMIVSTSGETSVGLYEGAVALSGEAGEKTLAAGGEASAGAAGITVQDRMSSLMRAEERRYRRVKGRVEGLRKRLEAREDFIDDYMRRQEKALSDFEKRRQEKLKKR